MLMDSSITPIPRLPGISLIQTTDFFYPNIDSPYWQGLISCANVLSDLYAMGITECDNMLMILGVCRDKAMLDKDRWRATELMMKGFGVQAARAGTKVTGGQTVMSPWFIVGGVASSVYPDTEIIKPTDAQPGDVLLLTKPLGTQVCSNLHVWLNHSDPNRFGRVSHLLSREDAILAYETAILSMSRLNKVGAELMRKYGAHAATDVTGFGILGHAKNLASNQTLPVQFVIRTLPVIAKTHLIDAIVPYRLTKGLSAETSGGLLVALPAEKAMAFKKEIEEREGWPCWVVGEVVEAAKGEERSAKLLTPEEGLEIVECPWRTEEAERSML